VKEGDIELLKHIAEVEDSIDKKLCVQSAPNVEVVMSTIGRRKVLSAGDVDMSGRSSG